MRKGELLEELKRALQSAPPPMSLATVREVRFSPGRKSIVLNVRLEPSGTIANARVMLPYVGPGRGLSFPIKSGQECLIVFPGGDPNHGVVVGFLPNGVDPVSNEASPTGIVLDGDEGDDAWVRIRGNAEITIDEDLTVAVTGDVVETVEGDVDRDVQGADTKLVQGDVDHTSMAVMRYRATQILVGLLLVAPQPLCNLAFWQIVRDHTHGGGSTSSQLQAMDPLTTLTQILKAE